MYKGTNLNFFPLFSSTLNNLRPVRKCFLRCLFCQSSKMTFIENAIHIKRGCTVFLWFIHRIFMILLYTSKLLYMAFCLEKDNFVHRLYFYFLQNGKKKIIVDKIILNNNIRWIDINKKLFFISPCLLEEEDPGFVLFFFFLSFFVPQHIAQCLAYYESSINIWSMKGCVS